jgi:hypothetical protein
MLIVAIKLIMLGVICTSVVIPSILTSYTELSWTDNITLVVLELGSTLRLIKIVFICGKTFTKVLTIGKEVVLNLVCLVEEDDNRERES